MWLAAGFVLLVLELITPSGFFIMFFGIGALVAGAAAATGLVASAGWQWLLFTIASVVCLLLFRGKIQAQVELTGARPPVDSLVGEIATPLDDIVPGAVGRAELRGTVWSARNSSAMAIIRGQRCRVVRVDGLMIFLEAEGVRA